MVRGFLFCLCLVFKEAIPLFSADYPPASLTIDQRPALIVGNYGISHYIIEKYYQRFADGIRQEKQRLPSQEERIRWMEDFLAKQIIISHGVSIGYLDRVEIRSIVDRMERHMLSMPSGAFYKWLYGTQPSSEAECQMMNALLPTVIDAMVVRFNGNSSAQACLGSDFTKLSLEAQTRMILECQVRGLELIDGPQRWPFTPFAELSEVLLKTKPGCWVEHVDPKLGVYFIFVRSVRTETVPGFPESFLQQMHNRILARSRRVSLLVFSSLSINEPVAQLLIEKMGKSPIGTEQPSAALFQDIDAKKLCDYRIGKEDFAVTVEGYRRHFNGLFVRQSPQSLADLRRSIEDMVIEELDVLAAREQGLDQTAQFIEDRHGFEGMQVVSLYEKEILTPQIKVTQTEIEEYYDQHAAEFRVVTKIRGRIFKFDSREKALIWMAQTNERKAGIETSPPISDEVIDLSSGQSILGPESLSQILMQSRDGTRHGPFVNGLTYTVFEKQKDAETRQIPLASVTDSIHGTITRRLLHERIWQLAVELAGQNKIDDRIEYARYGVPASALRLPWGRF